jgi:hypothetical protein
MTAQLDLFKHQHVPSYGAGFAKQRSMDDPEVRGMMATLNDARDRMMQSPEFKALQDQWTRDAEAKAPHDQPPSHAQRWHLHAQETAVAEAEAAAEQLDRDDDENERGELLPDRVPLDIWEALRDTYSADRIASSKNSPLRGVYDYARWQWVSVGAAYRGNRGESDYIKLFRVVADPDRTGFAYGSGQWRGYDGMAATLRGKPVKLVGPEWTVHPDLSSRSTLL